MKQFFLQVTALMILALGGLYFYANPDAINHIPLLPISSPSEDGSSPQVFAQKAEIVDPNNPSIQKVLINLEIADTQDDRSLGLGGRDILASDSGMLFIFEKAGKNQFWMKGMRIPLDFIWIKDDQIVDLLSNVPKPEPGQSDESLPRYAPNVDINRVLEVNAGFIATHDIRVGDKLRMVE